MKNLYRIALLTFACAAANASTIYFMSDTSVTNNSANPTLNLTGTLNPNAAWAAALPGSYWISYGSTGAPGDPGFFTPANGTVVLFTTQFVLTGPVSGASLAVLADDTTSVILNGHTIRAADLVPGAVCAAGTIGCITSTIGQFALADLQPYLASGVNTLSFAVLQMGGSSFGLDFSGSVQVSDSPEPGSLAMIAGGLIVFALLRRKR